MATHVITITCASPTDAENTLAQIRNIGFPIEGEDIVGNDVMIWIDQHRTDGIHHALDQLRNLGLKPHATSQGNG